MKQPVPTWIFSLVIVRLGRRILLVQESKHGNTWYLPAGRVEAGESPIEAAIRETKEESGLSVRIDGLVKIEMSQTKNGSVRQRFFFTGTPTTDELPKQQPDSESLQAGWFLMDEIRNIELRAEEVREMFEYVENGGQVFPLSIIEEVSLY